MFPRLPPLGREVGPSPPLHPFASFLSFFSCGCISAFFVRFFVPLETLCRVFPPTQICLGDLGVSGVFFCVFQVQRGGFWPEHDHFTQKASASARLELDARVDTDRKHGHQRKPRSTGAENMNGTSVPFVFPFFFQRQEQSQMGDVQQNF